MSETTELYRDLRVVAQRAGEERRQLANKSFQAAWDAAAIGGLTLVQRSDSHYQLSSPRGWLLNIYPGNQRLYRDTTKAHLTHLKLPSGPWTLIEVVNAAIQREALTVPK